MSSASSHIPIRRMASLSVLTLRRQGVCRRTTDRRCVCSTVALSLRGGRPGTGESRITSYVNNHANDNSCIDLPAFELAHGRMAVLEMDSLVPLRSAGALPAPAGRSFGSPMRESGTDNPVTHPIIESAVNKRLALALALVLQHHGRLLASFGSRHPHIYIQARNVGNNISSLAYTPVHPMCELSGYWGMAGG